MNALVLGAGGFIGSQMVKRLKDEGYYVVGVDRHYPEFEQSLADDFIIGDLRFDQVYSKIGVLSLFQEIYQFAAEMGGAGYIFTGEHDFEVMRNSALINLQLLARDSYLKNTQIFYSSSACMYPSYLQTDPGDVSLRESSAYPANPDSEYGWEKLFSERLYLAAARNRGLNVRVARFHNIYGPFGTYDGGREKAPAAMCRKAIEAKCTNKEMEIWGDGNQTRSFLYIEDCLDAVRMLMQSAYDKPINIGSEQMVTINRLAELAINQTGEPIRLTHNLNSNALGVRARNSNNETITRELGWSPRYSLELGMTLTYNWIFEQMAKRTERSEPTNY